MTLNTPVITIDGLSSSGKSTISVLLAEELGWHLLDSGILYRSLAYLTELESVDVNSEEKIHRLMNNFKLSNTNKSNIYRVIYKNKDITDYLNTESIGIKASIISKIRFVRDLLLPIQHSCIKEPGLIANGRDMGTIVFPKAILKIFFTADIEIRAQRRYEELLRLGEDVDFSSVISSLKARDEADKNRNISPMEPANDAQIVDSSELNIASVLDKILELYTISRVK